MRDHTASGPVGTGEVPRRSGAQWTGRMLRDLWDWLARRPLRLAEGERAVPHSASLRTVVMIFTASDVVVALLIDGKLPPAGRAVHLLWVVFSVTLTLGFCAMTIRTPHILDDTSLRLRTGPFRALTIPRTALASVSVAHRSVPWYGLRRALDSDDEVACSVGSATQLVVELKEPVRVSFRKGSPVLATKVYAAADDPAAAARQINRWITEGAQP
ncbi:hypothetical protein ACH49_21795 [Streptomyces leeuwenhoekii]|uniref:Integral Membrane Protein n=1 Tax=Streptomyces leeuwenhoekii TaxID=1437453 RepID=A0ABR5HUL2_STRLW|nr:hypothetical protein [Streptomyces leeuwenhoekii]KMS75261.1 hypothetical protein ACH49_21795 [Streptomyces leeuwenhoekii]